jgi:hypothetical protein
MKRAVSFILSIFREIAIKIAMTMAITVLILAAILVSAKVAFDHYFSNVCISTAVSFNQACLDQGPAPDPDKSRRSR